MLTCCAKRRSSSETGGCSYSQDTLGPGRNPRWCSLWRTGMWGTTQERMRSSEKWEELQTLAIYRRGTEMIMIRFLKTSDLNTQESGHRCLRDLRSGSTPVCMHRHALEPPRRGELPSSDPAFGLWELLSLCFHQNYCYFYVTGEKVYLGFNIILNSKI